MARGAPISHKWLSIRKITADEKNVTDTLRKVLLSLQRLRPNEF